MYKPRNQIWGGACRFQCADSRIADLHGVVTIREENLLSIFELGHGIAESGLLIQKTQFSKNNLEVTKVADDYFVLTFGLGDPIN